MAAVDENQTQRRFPDFPDDIRTADDGNNRIFKTKIINRFAEEFQGVDFAGLCVEQIGIEIFLTGLLFLRASVVINGKKNRGIFRQADPK